jgi:hypothetical protein
MVMLPASRLGSSARNSVGRSEAIMRWFSSGAASAKGRPLTSAKQRLVQRHVALAGMGGDGEVDLLAQRTRVGVIQRQPGGEHAEALPGFHLAEVAAGDLRLVGQGGQRVQREGRVALRHPPPARWRRDAPPPRRRARRPGRCR